MHVTVKTLSERAQGNTHSQQRGPHKVPPLLSALGCLGQVCVAEALHHTVLDQSREMKSGLRADLLDLEYNFKK